MRFKQKGFGFVVLCKQKGFGFVMFCTLVDVCGVFKTKRSIFAP